MGARGDRALHEGEIEAALNSMAADSPLRDGCAYIVSSPGQRFRASLVLDAASYGPRPDDPQVVQAAVAVELFHAATLAHDDVVDDGKLRRGRPAIGARSGNLTASLAGGWLCARSCELVAELGDEAAASFAETTAAVCDGEMLEFGDLHDAGRTRDRYLAVIEAKTASLFAFSAWLGATAGGASPAGAEALRRYGLALGMAFQIADDILDLLASPEQTGKTPGSDLRQGVYTLPVIGAIAADPDIAAELRDDPEPHELPGLVERILATSSLATAQVECAEWIERARAALPDTATPSAHGERLLALAESVGERAKETVAA
jgi:heptaprenyl diphosphate synthase